MARQPPVCYCIKALSLTFLLINFPLGSIQPFMTCH